MEYGRVFPTMQNFVSLHQPHVTRSVLAIITVVAMSSAAVMETADLMEKARAVITN